MISAIIDTLNAKLSLLTYFEKRYCLTELKKETKGEAEITSPVHYVGSDDWKKIEVDKYRGVSYWRKDGQVSVERAEDLGNAKDFVTVTFPLKLVAYVKRKDTTIDDEYSPDRIANALVKQLNFKNGELKTTLKAKRVISSVTDYSTDSAEIWEQETNGTGIVDVPFKFAVVSLSVELEVLARIDCLETECDQDSDILHAFNFCLPSVQDRLTNAQKTCLEDFLCPPCADATVELNGIEVGTIASGGTESFPVLQDGSPVGSWNGTQWIVPSCPSSASLAVALSDATPRLDETITITATPTDITPTSYTFFLPKQDGTFDVVTQASNVYNWKVKKYDAFQVTVYATDGSLEATSTASGTTSGDVDADAIIAAQEAAISGSMDATAKDWVLGTILRTKGIGTSIYEDVYAELQSHNAELLLCFPDTAATASVAGFSINAADPTRNATMVGFVPADATIYGITGGTGKYIIFNNAPSDYAQNGVCIGTYARESNTLSCQIGAGDGDFNTNDSGVNILCGQSANRAFIKCNSEDYLTVNGLGSVSRDTGWVWTQRNDAVNFQVGADGALLNVGQLASLTPSTHVYYGMALNNAGTAARFCPDSVSAFLNCGYLDECKMKVLTEAVEWLQTQIGRNV